MCLTTRSRSNMDLHTTTNISNGKIINAMNEANNKMKKNVRFQNDIKIREYNITIGDHPCCEDGLPISLDWEYYDKSTNSFHNNTNKCHSSNNTRSGKYCLPKRLSYLERRQKIYNYLLSQQQQQEQKQQQPRETHSKGKNQQPMLSKEEQEDQINSIIKDLQKAILLESVAALRTLYSASSLLEMEDDDEEEEDKEEEKGDYHDNHQTATHSSKTTKATNTAASSTTTSSSTTTTTTKTPVPVPISSFSYSDSDFC